MNGMANKWTKEANTKIAVQQKKQRMNVKFAVLA